MGNEQIKKITSSHWGAFEAIIENGKLISTKPFEEDLNPNDISKFIPNKVLRFLFGSLVNFGK